MFLACGICLSLAAFCSAVQPGNFNKYVHRVEPLYKGILFCEYLQQNFRLTSKLETQPVSQTDRQRKTHGRITIWTLNDADFKLRHESPRFVITLWKYNFIIFLQKQHCQ